MPAVTLDLWHTLLYVEPDDEETYMRAQVRIASEALARAPGAPGARPVQDPGELARAFEQVYAEAVAESSQGRTVTAVEQLLRAGRATGRLPETQPYLEALATEVARLPFHRAPGAIELLSALQDDGYRLGLISNTVGEPGRFLRPVLSSMGFDAYLEAYLFSDEHPWAKPAPEIFRAALALLGEPAERAVHVGDGWSDIEGARRAGLRAGILFTGLNHYGARYKALFLPGNWDRPATPHVARRLDEVLTLVREILPANVPS